MSICLPAFLEDWLENLESDAALLPSIRSKYQSSLQHIAPDIGTKSHVFAMKKKVFLGVSLGSPAFVGNPFLALVDLLEKFPSYDIVIAKILYEMTLQIQHGLDPEESVQVATLVAVKTKEHQEQLLKLNGRRVPDFLFLEGIEETSFFKEAYEELEKELQANGDLQKIFQEFAGFYMDRIMKGRAVTQADIGICYRYLLTELVLFGYLNLKGFQAMIYPGRIATISDTLSLGIPVLDKLYPDFHYVSARIKRKRLRATDS